MMKYRIIFFFMLCTQLVSLMAYSQTKQVVFEQVQMYSIIKPDGKYWQPSTSDIEAFAYALDTSIFKGLALERATSFTTAVKSLTKQNQIGKLIIDWSKTKEIPYHAYLEIYELPPQQTFGNNMVPFIIPKKDSIQSTWFLTCTILDENKKATFQKTILIGMIPTMNQGVGYPINVPVTTPKSLFKAILSGIGYFNKYNEDIEYIEAKVPTSYATDNFTMPLLHAKQRIAIDTNKGFLQFIEKNERTLLKISAATLNKINTKDKTLANPFYAVLPAIKKRSTTLFKEYYQALQPLRNVVENKDYTIEAYLEFNPMADPELRGQAPIKFLPDSLHKIFADTTLIGNFKVIDQGPIPGKFYNANEIYNGYDSSYIYKLGSSFPKGPIIQSKTIEGNIGNDTFKIVFLDDIELKIIYLNEVALLATQGLNKPHQFIPINELASKSNRSLLLMIANSEIFQSPN